MSVLKAAHTSLGVASDCCGQPSLPTVGCWGETHRDSLEHQQHQRGFTGIFEVVLLGPSLRIGDDGARGPLRNLRRLQP
jgi:hypothetical protein